MIRFDLYVYVYVYFQADVTQYWYWSIWSQNILITYIITLPQIDFDNDDGIMFDQCEKNSFDQRALGQSYPIMNYDYISEANKKHVSRLP